TPTSTPTPIPPCGPGADYIYLVSTSTIDAGGTLVAGSQCLDCVVPITLPFSYSLYGQSYSVVNASSDGNLQFLSTSTAFNNTCLQSALLNNAILPWWDGMDSTATITNTFTTGLFTSTSGSAPNRTFNIQWRACRFNNGACNAGSADFEVRL